MNWEDAFHSGPLGGTANIAGSSNIDKFDST